MIILDPKIKIAQAPDTSVLDLINRLGQVIAQLQGFKDDLEDCYPAHTLRALVRHFETLSVEFQAYLSTHNHQYHTIFEHYSEWPTLVIAISRAAHRLASQLEQYARKPETFSWVMTHRGLNDLEIAVTNLHTLCVKTNDQSLLRTLINREQAVMLELPPRPLPSSLCDVFAIIERWADWLRMRPQIEIGHNIHLLHNIGVDFAMAIDILQSIHTQFTLKQVSLAQANRYYIVISALEETRAFLEEIEAIGVGSRRHAQTLTKHLKRCYTPLGSLCSLTDAQGLAYVVFDTMT